jgi:hypothetical protein
MTTISQDQLARRIAAGSGCADRGCQVAFITDPKELDTLDHPFTDLVPGDGVLVHICELQQDIHRNLAHVKGEVVVQLLDEDDLKGTEKRLHLMEHFSADHQGTSPQCGSPGHDDAPPHIQAIFIGGIGMPDGVIPPDMLMDAIRALASANPKLMHMLRKEFGDAE